MQYDQHDLRGHAHYGNIIPRALVVFLKLFQWVDQVSNLSFLAHQAEFYHLLIRITHFRF